VFSRDGTEEGGRTALPTFIAASWQRVAGASRLLPMVKKNRLRSWDTSLRVVSTRFSESSSGCAWEEEGPPASSRASRTSFSLVTFGKETQEISEISLRGFAQPGSGECARRGGYLLCLMTASYMLRTSLARMYSLLSFLRAVRRLRILRGCVIRPVDFHGLSEGEAHLTSASRIGSSSVGTGFAGTRDERDKAWMDNQALDSPSRRQWGCGVRSAV
jgi:hypothetical protein